MIRYYQDSDQEKLLELLRLNIPQFFAPSEEQDFIEYLEQHSQHYLVVEEDGAIVGAGGFNDGFDNGTAARISWDFVHPDFQGKGIGKKLTMHRINEIKKNPEVTTIVVRTSQLAFKFYEKLGFTLEKIEPDFWAKGFDLYQMKLSIR